MKKIFLYSVIALLAALASCTKEKEVLEDVETDISNPPSQVQYDGVITGYADTIASALPSMNGTTNVIFGIEKPVRIYIDGEMYDYATGVYDSAQIQTLFSTAEKDGNVLISNSLQMDVAELPYGDYVVDVYTDYRGGTVVHDSAITFHLINLAVALEKDLYESELKTSDLGVFQTVKGMITDPEETELEITSYKLMDNAPEWLSIDSLSGEISKNTVYLDTGDYQFGVMVNTNIGGKYFDSTVAVTVDPLDITVTYPEVDLAFLHLGEVSSPTVAGGELSDADPSSFRYSFVDEVIGFSIDSLTGVISRPNLSNSQSTNNIRVVLKTDIGNTLVSTAVVNIAPKPVMSFTSGGNATTKVTMSPWTGFTDLQIVLDQLSANNQTYSITSDIEGLTVDANTGVISMAEEQAVDVGEYLISVDVYVDGIDEPVPYSDVYTVVVEVKSFDYTGGIENINQDILTAEYNGVRAYEYSGLVQPAWAQTKMYANSVDASASIPHVKTVFGDAAAFELGRIGVVQRIPLDGTNGRIKSIQFSYLEAASVLYGAGVNFTRTVELSYKEVDASNYVADDWTTIVTEGDENGWSSGYFDGIQWGITNARPYLLPSEATKIERPIDVSESDSDHLFVGMFFDMHIKMWVNFGIADIKYTTIEAYNAIFE
ncbi:hypothetical protein [Flammeovirga sp. SubArs3]|uniref:hypothetical protein n=1 Tax=Flammeovirga sp. SubArs3 TaxID=2995316 RepID=UPI00248AC586|nr:hypothetical protein [Flammeovirga sp. SubArs3]